MSSALRMDGCLFIGKAIIVFRPLHFLIRNNRKLTAIIIPKFVGIDLRVHSAPRTMSLYSIHLITEEIGSYKATIHHECSKLLYFCQLLPPFVS